MENEQFDKILRKIQQLKEGNNPLDLSSKEDLAVGIMNLISLEEHLFFTYNKTGEKNYLELLKEIREMRKGLLRRIVHNPQGEVWCISKHLLAAAMRLMEVGTKKIGEGKEKEAKELFHKSYVLWNIFWGLNLDIIPVKDIKETITEGDNIVSGSKSKTTVWSKLGKIIESILDCCRE